MFSPLNFPLGYYQDENLVNETIGFQKIIENNENSNEVELELAVVRII